MTGVIFFFFGGGGKDGVWERDVIIYHAVPCMDGLTSFSLVMCPDPLSVIPSSCEALLGCCECHIVPEELNKKIILEESWFFFSFFLS